MEHDPTNNPSTADNPWPGRKAPPQWYTPPIDRRELRELMRRDDRHALFSYGLWFALLGVLGTLAALRYSHPWSAVPLFLLYGTVAATCNARWHESMHGTPFRTPWLNDVVFFIASTMELRDVVFTRWSHVTHHSYTVDPEVDLEVVLRPIKLWQVLLDFFYIWSGLVYGAQLVRHALGRPTRQARRVVPPDEFRKMFRAARAGLALHLAAIALSVATRSWIPVLLFTLPRFYGGFLIYLFILTQHAGLAQGVDDHRLSTRTVYLNPVFSFLYMHMEYHIEHHIFPNVPFHALPRLHRAILPHMPSPPRGLRAAFREIGPAVLKQTRDANHFIRRELPPA